MTELLSQHPELQKREAAINNQKERERQAHEEQEKRERTEKENKEAQQTAASEVDQKTNETAGQPTPETANEKEVEQAEPRKEIPLPDLIAEFDENKANIERMDGEIDRLASVNNQNYFYIYLIFRKNYMEKPRRFQNSKPN